jgi:hypothetical protein
MPSGYFPRIKILKLPEGVNESSQLRPYLISRRSSHHTNHYEIYVDHSELKMPSDIYGDVYAKELWKLAHKKGENHFVQSHRNPLNDSVKEKEWDVIPLRPHPIQEGGAHHYEVEVTTFAGLHEKTQKNSVELFHNPSSENKLLEEALRNLCKKSARGVIEKFKESKGL